MKKKTKIIILGGSSFVGIHLSNLLKKEFKITSTFFKQKIKLSKLIETYKFNFKDKIFFNKLKKFDVIIHLATQKELLSQKKNFKYEKLFFNKITDYCIKENKNFIYLSSSLVYKNKKKNYETSKKLDHHKNEYINSKIIFDKIIINKIEKGLKVLMLRIPSIYGTKLENIKLINLNKKNLLLNKTINFYRSKNNYIRFVHVDDICKVIKKSIKLNITGVYNLESGENIKIFNIIKFLQKNLKSKSKIKITNKNINSISFPNLEIMKIKKIFNIIPKKKFISLLRKIK